MTDKKNKMHKLFCCFSFLSFHTGGNPEIVVGLDPRFREDDD